MTGLRVTYTPSTDSPSEQARDARAHAWAYVFECFHRREGQEGGHATTPDATKNAASMTSTNSTSVRHTEGVGDVGQRPD